MNKENSNAGDCKSDDIRIKEMKHKFEIFNILFESTLEVLDDIELDKENQNSEIHYSPFIEFSSKNSSKKNHEIAKSLYKYVQRLEITISELVVGFIYVERLILENRNLINRESLEK